MKIIVLGAGLVGAPMALDLAAEPDFEVTVADVNESALARLEGRPRLATIRRDLSQPKGVEDLVRDFDLVLSAVPGFMGFATLQAVIAAGRDVVDIAFFPEDPFLLDGQARARGVTAVVDCGVAPGMSNILVGHVDALLDETGRVLIYVGGLPEVRRWPFEYKAVFSPVDVIEEYVRPARFVEHGQVVVRPALSEPRLLDFPGVGTLEAFNTDGLRTLARTIRAPFMKEMTLRYPGHIALMRVFRETGLFGREEVEVGGVRLRPLDLTAKLLFPLWKLEDGERDLTVMRVEVEGRKGGESLVYVYDLLDRFDPATRTHSMARTTGYTATTVVRMLARGLCPRKGIVVPEFIGADEACVKFVLDGLGQKGIVYRESITRP
jgi:lysine 6-dehydrogenase